MDNRTKTHQTTECGILMAVGLALSLVKIFHMPSGGSVSLGILPLLLIAARRGFRVGTICGATFGIIMIPNGATIMHPIQFLLDYPLAYAAMGIAGLMKWDNGLKAATATTVANIVRLHFHVIAGAVFFSTNKENFREALAYSYAYNCGHIVPETIICAAIACFIASKHQDLCSQQDPS